MPHLALHTLIAHRLIGHWRTLDTEPPFDPLDPTTRNALALGAWGPDMGLFPGGYPLLSALVHRVRSGQLLRALLATANTDAQRAYAWGWLTHILADAHMHPAIDTAAARLLGRKRIRYGDPRQETAHIRVEVGIDAECIAREPELVETSVAPAFDRRSVGWLVDALRATYGPVFRDTDVLRSHLAVVRYHGIALSIAGSIGRSWYGRPRGRAPLRRTRRITHRPIVALVRPAMRRVATATKLAALLNPLQPSPALQATVQRAEKELPRVLERHRRTRLVLLPDHDLETGGIEDPARPTATAAATLRNLAARGTAVSPLPPAPAEA